MKSKRFFTAIVLLMATVFVVSGCGPSSDLFALDDNTQIEDAKDQLARQLLDLEGIVGIGIGECNNRPCITVYLENDSPELRAKVPKEFQGFPVIAEVTGPIEIQLEND